MTEALIFELIPLRIKQLGYHNYHVRYRDLTILPNSRELVNGANQLYFVVDHPQGIKIESDYGVYNETDQVQFDNAHEHKGEIVITNPFSTAKKVKFIQVIIVN